MQLFIASVAFFLAWPRFDIFFSRLFFDAGTGTFPWQDNKLVSLVYSLTHTVGMKVLGVIVLLATTAFIFRHNWLRRRRKALVFLLCVALLGPALIVNVGLKDHWGRYRPNAVVEFGGLQDYQPPFPPHPEARCEHCASFVSGHASVGFYFFALALLAGRRRWLWAPALAGAGIGLVRIAQGGHFFSDVLFAGWVLWFCSLLLHKLFFESPVFVGVPAARPAKTGPAAAIGPLTAAALAWPANPPVSVAVPVTRTEWADQVFASTRYLLPRR